MAMRGDVPMRKLYSVFCINFVFGISDKSNATFFEKTFHIHIQITCLLLLPVMTMARGNMLLFLSRGRV